MAKTQFQHPETILQGEFVETTVPPRPQTPNSQWQRRKNGVGYTFHAELTQLENRLDTKFTGLHQHLGRHHSISQAAIAQWFGNLDERVLQNFHNLDRKLNIVLATQRTQAKQRLTLWLMVVLTAGGAYITLIHPLLRPAQPIVPTLQQFPANSAPVPNVPLPTEIPKG
ncbi:MAG: hypothetical protein F6J87_10450 [Spirulina sp. SIO3F2]|nr:hypothetical protein [Spirulina sp. SIO3F2]